MSSNVKLDLMAQILVKEHGLALSRVLGLVAERRALRARGRVVSLLRLAVDFKLLDPDRASRAGMLYARLAGRPGQPKPLGHSVYEAGLTTGMQILAALDEQRISHERLGAILVRRGLLTATQLEMLLTLQRNERRSLVA